MMVVGNVTPITACCVLGLLCWFVRASWCFPIYTATKANNLILINNNHQGSRCQQPRSPFRNSGLHATAAARSEEEDVDVPPTLAAFHHVALKTRNITTAIQFYSLFGFVVHHKFRAGPARAAWLKMEVFSPRLHDDPTQPSEGTKTSMELPEISSTQRSRCFLELIEVPSFMLQEEPGTRKLALDLAKRPELLGWNHMALDVTEQVVKQRSNNNNNGRNNATLSKYMEQLNATSLERFGKTLRVALEPQQKLIGNEVYELAFLYDADGCLIELLHKQAELAQSIDPGWEPLGDLTIVGGNASKQQFER
ncbi:hypothetical protein ACA910_000949 [Epithemia clementina (nom. ined.)]